MKYFLILFIMTSVLFAQANESQRYIYVNGTSEISITADQAEFVIQFRTVQKSIEESKQVVDNSVKRIVNTLSNFNINKDDVLVEPAMLGKNYEYRNNSRIQTGFFASVNVSFTLKDLSKYYPLFGELSGDEVIETVNSSFSLSGYEKHNREAYEKALKAAAEKVDYMCKSIGVKPGKVLVIEEENQGFRPVALNSMAMDKSAEFGGSISGKVQIIRTVRVKYEIID
ncbi:MAG: SIMPL domain-containing protein [Ignavibacteriaceae bacterium]